MCVSANSPTQSVPLSKTVHSSGFPKAGRGKTGILRRIADGCSYLISLLEPSGRAFVPRIER